MEQEPAGEAVLAAPLRETAVNDCTVAIVGPRQHPVNRWAGRARTVSYGSDSRGRH